MMLTYCLVDLVNNYQHGVRIDNFDYDKFANHLNHKLIIQAVLPD